MKRTKKVSIFLISVVLTAALNIEIFAAETTGLLNATVSVEQIFAISASPLTLEFGNIDAGPVSVTDEKELKLYCATNNNNPWEASIVWLSPLTSDTFTIPNENFLWRGKSTGFGTFHKVAGHLDTNPIVFYSSSNEEFITAAPIEFTFQFKIQIPENQAAGTYSTTMVVTMKDTSTSQEIKTSPLNITVTVNPKLAISVSPSSLDFGALEPGQRSGAKTMSINCVTNNNNPWSLSIHATSELTSGTFTIPNENFSWYTLSQSGYGETGYGEVVVGRTMSTAPYTFYNSSIDEYITTTPVKLSLNFDVYVPPEQRGGKYTTTLILTMTESGVETLPRR